MDLASTLHTLLRRPFGVALAVVVAVAASISVGYQVSFSPPGLEKRGIETAAATAQLLIDSPRSALGDLAQDTTPLATRALLFAEFMDSAAFKRAIAKEAKVSPNAITTEGPFTSVGVRPNIARSADAASAAGSGGARPYRLVFDAEDNLPVITIYAEAPDANRARSLADASVNALRRYVGNLQTANKANKANKSDGDRVVIRSLGPAEGGPVNPGARTKLVMLTFIVALVLGLAVISRLPSFFPLTALRRAPREDTGSAAS